MSGARYKHFKTICEHTFDNSPTDWSSSFLKWWSCKQGLETLYTCSDFLFAKSQNLSTHFGACPSMSQDHATVFARSFFNTLVIFQTILIPPTCTDKNNPCFRRTNRRSQFGTLSHPSFKELFQFVSEIWQVGVRTSFESYHRIFNDCQWFRPFVSWKTYPYDWTLRLWNFEQWWCILNWVSADTASAACPAQSSSLALTSITFSAVILDADDPCSVKTA